jgi:hypothetical protein
MKKLFAALLTNIVAIGAAQAGIIWEFDLGPVLVSPGPNSISSGGLRFEIESDPVSVIDRADDRGWYQTGWSVSGGALVLNGVEFGITGGSIGQTQCWDTDVFSNPCGSFDFERLSIYVNLSSGGYLEMQDIRSPDFNLPDSYADYIWSRRPKIELTAPYHDLIDEFGWYGQGLRYSAETEGSAFQFYVTSWQQVPEPSSIVLMLVAGVRLVGVMHNRKSFKR